MILNIAPTLRRALIMLSTFIGSPALAQVPTATAWSSVDEILGRRGSAQPGDVMKYSFPRGDLTVSVDGLRLRPALALGSWVAFKSVGSGQVMAMGDLVLLEREIAPVVQTLQVGGVEQTAIHNHVLMESPRVMYMHISAHGDGVAIARTIRSALARTGTPLGASAPAASVPIDLDTAMIARTLGISGTVNGGVYQVSVPRRETILQEEHEIPPSMGVATAINFQSTGNGHAAVTGDFVMTAGEVNKVIRALTSGGIAPTALHSHMLTETPRLFFMHFWGNEEVKKLAATLRTALDQMSVRTAPSTSPSPPSDSPRSGAAPAPSSRRSHRARS